MTKIHVKGAIVSDDVQRIYDWVGIEATSPSKINQALATSNKKDIEVIINSPGGNVFAGSEIYTALKEHVGNVTVKIVGVAASAASVIAMAADKILMSPTANMMIHNVSTTVSGDYRQMQHAAAVLESTNQSIMNAYKTRTNKTDAELKEMMDAETWFNAQSAVENGFADEVMFEQQQQHTSTFVASFGAMLNDEAVMKIKQLIEAEENAANNKQQMELQARLKLLQLNGGRWNG